VSRVDYASFTAARRGRDEAASETVDFAERHADALREHVRSGEPLSRSEIYAWLGLDPRLEAQPPLSWEALRIRGRLAHTPDSALWSTPRRMRFGAVEVELPEMQAARTTLVRRYLAAFGPATRADIARGRDALSRRPPSARCLP
jgi:hypothetical protein